MALIAGMAPGTCNFFLSLEKEIIKMQVVGGSRTPSTGTNSISRYDSHYITSELAAGNRKFRTYKVLPLSLVHTCAISITQAT